MDLEQIASRFLKHLGREDLMVLAILIFLVSENRCDRNLKLVLLIIFLSGIDQGLFQ